MNITRTCILTGVTNTRFVEGLTHGMLMAHKQGAMAQDAFVGITAEWREFIMTGILPDVWEARFGPDEPGLSLHRQATRARVHGHRGTEE